jgi:hypothetical protein
VTEYSTQLLVASRLSELCRQACAYAGLPTRGMWPAGVRFVVRSGQEPAELLVKLLQEALAEEAPEIAPAGDHLDSETLPASQVLVREGFDSPCPIGRDLEQLVSPGRPLAFAIERRDAHGRLLSRTWVVLSEELPLSEVPLTAAVARETFSCAGGAGEAVGPAASEPGLQLRS